MSGCSHHFLQGFEPPHPQKTSMRRGVQFLVGLQTEGVETPQRACIRIRWDPRPQALGLHGLPGVPLLHLSPRSRWRPVGPDGPAFCFSLPEKGKATQKGPNSFYSPLKMVNSHQSSSRETQKVTQVQVSGSEVCSTEKNGKCRSILASAKAFMTFCE